MPADLAHKAFSGTVRECFAKVYKIRVVLIGASAPHLPYFLWGPLNLTCLLQNMKMMLMARSMDNDEKLVNNNAGLSSVR